MACLIVFTSSLATSQRHIAILLFLRGTSSTLRSHAELQEGAAHVQCMVQAPVNPAVSRKVPHSKGLPVQGASPSKVHTKSEAIRLISHYSQHRAPDKRSLRLQRPTFVCLSGYVGTGTPLNPKCPQKLFNCWSVASAPHSMPLLSARRLEPPSCLARCCVSE